MTFDISLEQCHKMFGEIGRIQDQTLYLVASRNCTTEALKVLKAAGIDLNKPIKVRLPDAFTSDGGMWTPAQLSARLREIEAKKKQNGEKRHKR